MENITRFIELYLDRNSGKHNTEFKVCCKKSNSVWAHDVVLPILKLDEEDLEYLYKKYVKQYKQIKEQEIKNIQDKINNL